jgi:hypothetical protein
MDNNSNSSTPVNISTSNNNATNSTPSNTNTLTTANTTNNIVNGGSTNSSMISIKVRIVDSNIIKTLQFKNIIKKLKKTA